MDPYPYISESNRLLLSQVYAAIDDSEDRRLLTNWRQVGDQDRPDIDAMAQAGMTLADLFAYARRPRREVLQYMLSQWPLTLDALLTNTRKKMAPGS